MLKEKNCIDRKLSKYLCDMCKGDINNPIRIYVDLREGQTKKFKWHLCDRCYKKIASVITHYAERKVEKKDEN